MALVGSGHGGGGLGRGRARPRRSRWRRWSCFSRSVGVVDAIARLAEGVEAVLLPAGAADGGLDVPSARRAPCSARSGHRSRRWPGCWSRTRACSRRRARSGGRRGDGHRGYLPCLPAEEAHLPPKRLHKSGHARLNSWTRSRRLRAPSHGEPLVPHAVQRPPQSSIGARPSATAPSSRPRTSARRNPHLRPLQVGEARARSDRPPLAPVAAMALPRPAVPDFGTPPSCTCPRTHSMQQPHRTATVRERSVQQPPRAPAWLAPPLPYGRGAGVRECGSAGGCWAGSASRRADGYGPPLRSSVSTSLATALSVSNTPTPVRATPSKSGTFVGLSSSRSSSTVAISGRSRLLYWMT